MLRASYTGYGGLRVRESLDQQSVKLQNKTDLPFPLSDDPCLKRKMRCIVSSSEKAGGVGGVWFSTPEPRDARMSCSSF